jgi:hypothetical protein
VETATRQFHYGPAIPTKPAFTLGDGFILLAVATTLYGGTRLAFHVPAVITGPEITLAPEALPWYTPKASSIKFTPPSRAKGNPMTANSAPSPGNREQPGRCPTRYSAR